MAGALDHTNIKIGVMHEIHVFDRIVWFANCLYCTYQEVGNRAICLRIYGLQVLSSTLYLNQKHPGCKKVAAKN